jgi:protein TonB
MASPQPSLPSRRLLLALSASLLLHAAAIALLERVRLLAPKLPQPAPAALYATLMPPPAAQLPQPEPEPVAEPLLKNDAATPEPDATPSAPIAEPVPPVSGHPAPQPTAAAAASMRRKLSEHVFYPPEAVAQGLPGEVRLLVALDRTGKIVAAKVVVSSGHPLLDRAAVGAAYAIGRLPGAGVLDMILPVIFKLE